MSTHSRGVSSWLTLPTAGALMLGLITAMPQGAAFADGGYWQLTAAKEFSWPPAQVVSPLSFDGTSGYYSWAVRGGYSGGQLTSVDVTETSQLPSSCNWLYKWTLPPATAIAGQNLPVTLDSSGSCAGSPWFWDIGFDFADMQPGTTSGWSYPGNYFKPQGKGAAVGSVTFPQPTPVVDHPVMPGQMRLQVKAERWAIQYVYTWVKGTDPTPGPTQTSPPTPTPTPQVTVPGAPQAVRIKAMSAKKARLTWSPPITGSAPASYTAYVRSRAGKGKWSSYKAMSASGTAVLVKVRKRGAKLQAYVSASNSAGTGPASSLVKVTLPRR